jgi:predicted DNA-binding protein (MmcQ/YjbR family)
MSDLERNIETLRGFCLSLPEAEEQVFGGHTTPTWRVRGKIFAKLGEGRNGLEWGSVWLKAADGAQGVLVGANPERFFVPPYVGPRGWVGIYIDGHIDWPELKGLVAESYPLIAPRRLAAQLGATAHER